MAMIYLLPNLYFESFKEVMYITRFDFNKHQTAGLSLTTARDHLLLGSITPSTPAEKIPRWGTRIKGAWLIWVHATIVTSIKNAQDAFEWEATSITCTVILLFSHPKIQLDISNNGLPIMSSAPFHKHVHDQINNRWDFTMVVEHLRKAPPYKLVDDGRVLSCVTKVMKLTQRKLL